MWFSILKVDRFTNEGGFKGLYNEETKEISVNLDNFISRSKLMNEARRNKIKNIKEAMYIYFNYAIINEKYAYATGKTDNTIGSIRKVLTQIGGFIRKVPNIRKEDKYISNLIREMYEELTTNIKREG